MNLGLHLDYKEQRKKLLQNKISLVAIQETPVKSQKGICSLKKQQILKDLKTEEEKLWNEYHKLIGFEKNAVLRWVKQAERDEEIYWKTKFENSLLEEKRNRR